MVSCICENCGKLFEVHEYRDETAHFCSRKCYNSSRAQKAYERVCALCGASFSVTRETRGRQYCSLACRQTATRKYDHSDKTCLYCERIFPYTDKNPDKVFCSHLCALKSRAFEVNENFFHKVESEGQAYALGLVFSDGCIYTTDNKKYLNFPSKDYGLVELFRNLLSSAHTIYHVKDADSYSVTICNGTLYNDLHNLGVHERKSWKEYSLPPIPQHLIRHFIRGFYDGDGCTFISKIQQGRYQYLHLSFTCASRQFLSEIKVVLERENIFPQKIHPDRNNAKLIIARQDSVLCMLNYLYRDANYLLQRKYEVAQRFYDGQIPDSL
ncbi:MAG: hypothetical protein H0T73_20080 [Ardenticatenales bacterium]|nr:hypothetical protein [Ardenticatenales bacterium]